MTSDYGTTDNQKEQLSGYFDTNSEDVSIKNGGSRNICGTMSKKKKIAIIISVVVIVLLVVVIVVAVTTQQQSARNQGEISSLKSGQGCSGDSSKQSRCRTGQCIQNLFVCDGFNDCPGGEDEVRTSCDKLKKKPPCKDDQFRCLESRNCIDKKKRCDGAFNCGEDDFSDERNCFAIETETSVVSVLKAGKKYLMSADTDNRIAEQICQDLGFRSLRYIIPPDAYTNDENSEQIVSPVYCGRVNIDFDPDEDINDSDDTLIKQVEIVTRCDERKLRLICAHDYCGVFGNFTGPPIPDSWISPEMKTEPKIAERKFPWVVDIYRGDTWKCKGAIVSSEWILIAEKCLDKNILGIRSKKRTWTVRAAGDTESPQERQITKVMRTHFEKMPNRKKNNNLVAIQVDPPFVSTGQVQQACLALPALLPHFKCFAAGNSKTGGDTQHVRVLPQNGTQSCNVTEIGTYCFSYPHVGSPSSCINTFGSPISCLDPATNSWKLSGIITSDMACEKEDRLAAFVGDEYNFYWAQAVTAYPRIFGNECQNSAEFKEIRFLSGNRRGEVYLDVKGLGELDMWHTVYNLSTALNPLKQRLFEGQIYPAVRVTNNTGITSSLVAFLQCPPKAVSLCSCKVKYRRYTIRDGEAQALHFSAAEDSDKDGKIDFTYDNWDEDDNLDDQYEDYEDFENPEKVNPDEIFTKACENRINARQCLNGTGCVTEEFICDTNVDCADGSDEDRDTCEKIAGSTCPDRWFKCKTTYDCIPYVDRCNGVNECSDFSDERDCVSVDDNGIVMVEKSGLALPLTELPRGVSEASRTFLASALCRYMGFSTSTPEGLQTETADSSIFSQGCYKLNADKFGESNVLSTDFTQQDPELCTNYLSLRCEPPACGITAKHLGPQGPANWPKSETDGGNKNHDYPWAVHIKKGEDILCAATIVLPQWVVTTADCVSELTDDLKIVFLDAPAAAAPIHRITHKVNHTTTRKHLGQPTERNIMMFGVHPEFPTNVISHPLCLIPPLYVSLSTCYVSGHDNTTKKLEHIRVVPRENQVCRDANRQLSKAYDDQQCVQYVNATATNTCILTKGSALQCLDRLRDQWKFTAIMTMDIGDGCEGANSSIAAATNTRFLLPWMSLVVDDIEDLFNVTCSEEDKVIFITYRKSNYDKEWYMMTDDGLAVKWDETNETTLNILTNPLKTIYAAFKATSTRRSDHIAALKTVTLSQCESQNRCTCTFSREPKEEGVQKFYLVILDSYYEEEEEQKLEEEDEVIGDLGFTTPFEFLTSTVTEAPAP